MNRCEMSGLCVRRRAAAGLGASRCRVVRLWLSGREMLGLRVSRRGLARLWGSRGERLSRGGELGRGMRLLLLLRWSL